MFTPGAYQPATPVLMESSPTLRPRRWISSVFQVLAITTSTG